MTTEQQRRGPLYVNERDRVFSEWIRGMQESNETVPLPKEAVLIGKPSKSRFPHKTRLIEDVEEETV